MKIWLDDIRESPSGFIWCKSVNQAIKAIKDNIGNIELIDCDHDLGDFYEDGGDGIKLLDWIVENNFNYLLLLINIHTMNPIGRKNMQRIIDRYYNIQNCK